MSSYILGRIIESHKQQYIVKHENNIYNCYIKGKKNHAAVGDWVYINKEIYGKNSIEKIQERKNIFYRSDNNKRKYLAANIDHIIIIVATEPSFSTDIIGNLILEAMRCNIDITIILNKDDIKEQVLLSLDRIKSITPENIPIINLSAKNLTNKEIIFKMYNLLINKTNLLVGQSGMGKSTILNKLVPSAHANTQEYSKYLGTGKHTTSHVKLYDLNIGNSFIIDSPGFQEFSIKHININDINKGFPEFSKFIKECQFYNCSHHHEPGCAIINAVLRGDIKKGRYSLYKKIIKEYQANKKYLRL
ncbi:ribosome biogenesis GTPase [Candidatus Kinetoplastibacterium desouzaii TCC079E]|uniref:Small ribosomal subunit biogenesis GTPase RsgA n=1 Tax=Candidatus Kinetoplastidibacterium desouzai TCC079E TaxID=1208919 RepID=M1LUI2_9PROT|nr:ribosome small subunit-dependent GTPase A [Candidatus Kinetoplastibacterium desouzaii]AGF46969.1 ribosome biogenesis GTPase [Candidatus Kinetoplastibacterium desouzaii TCC079E]